MPITTRCRPARTQPLRQARHLDIVRPRNNPAPDEHIGRHEGKPLDLAAEPNCHPADPAGSRSGATGAGAAAVGVERPSAGALRQQVRSISAIAAGPFGKPFRSRQRGPFSNTEAWPSTPGPSSTPLPRGRIQVRCQTARRLRAHSNRRVSALAMVILLADRFASTVAPATAASRWADSAPRCPHRFPRGQQKPRRSSRRTAGRCRKERGGRDRDLAATWPSPERNVAARKIPGSSQVDLRTTPSSRPRMDGERAVIQCPRCGSGAPISSSGSRWPEAVTMCPPPHPRIQHRVCCNRSLIDSRTHTSGNTASTTARSWHRPAIAGSSAHCRIGSSVGWCRRRRGEAVAIERNGTHDGAPGCENGTWPLRSSASACVRRPQQRMCGLTRRQPYSADVTDHQRRRS